LCRIGCPDGGWTIERCGKEVLWGIAIYCGDLYGITWPDEILLKFHIGVNGEGAPVVTAAHPLTVQRRDGPRYEYDKGYRDYYSYIFELCGNLAMAVRTIYGHKTASVSSGCTSS
jgi:hypothetical protein